jgi:hypothetical protein
MQSNVGNDSLINDIRNVAEFKSYSFSKYKKTDVRDALIDNMSKGKVEPACYWAAELVCSGHFMEIWESILYFVGKYIHLANPKLMIYLNNRYSIFRNIMTQGHYINELDLRNFSNIRKLFSEIICNLTLSPKKPAFESIKINRVEEFDITQMTERLIAPSVKYIEPIFLPKDPKEIFIPMNEFAYNISPERKNMVTACYWIEWVIEFDALCKNRKTPCRCEKRSTIPVEKKYQCDLIWIIWDIFFHTLSMIPYSEFRQKILKSIFEMFCIKYTAGSCKKRKYLLYYAIELFTEPITASVDIVTNHEVLKMVVDKIDNIYKQIKKNEESPGTEYLFSNINSHNTFNDSVKKIKIMENMNFGYNPLDNNNNNEDL